MSLIEFQNIFSAFMKAEAKTLENEALRLTAANAHDEAKFAKIQLNIVEIFTQLLNTSIEKTKNSADWSNDCPQSWSTPLSQTYLAFFEKIPAPWQVNLEKCQLHGLHEEAHIESLKLAMADQLKSAFEQQLQDYLSQEKDVN